VLSLRAGEARSPLTLTVLAVAPEHVERVALDLKAIFPRALLGRLGLSRVGVLATEDVAAVRHRIDQAARAIVGVEVVPVPRIAGGAAQFLALAEAALGRAGLAP
jgi:hypothetical protein